MVSDRKAAPAGITSIDDYLTGFPSEVREVLQEIRRVAHEAVPGAGETIKYQMPTLTLNGRSLVHFAGWKAHISLYPEPGPDGALEHELDPFRSGRGTLKFPLDRPIPYALIGRVVQRLAEERSADG
jgi:uncharacterized protein YdhG (YjbR/CyaY superfamily)